MLSKADTLARLQREILSLQGFARSALHPEAAAGFAQVNQAFPNKVFPRSALHEFFSFTPEDATASAAFAACLLSGFLHDSGAVVWIGTARKIFPPALSSFGLQPEHVFFLDLKKEADVLWAMEEALKCTAVTAVVGEIRELSFTASRRLQLIMEKSGSTCFALRCHPKNLATASVARWQVKPVQSGGKNGLPGVGYPCWQVQLCKVRNGKPGTWNVEWRNGQLRPASTLTILQTERQRKTG